MSHLYDNEQYQDYEDDFDAQHVDRKARRKRKVVTRHTPKKSYSAIVEDIAETEGLEGGFNPTYIPGRFEAGWLLDSLKPFYDSSVIIDVLSAVKGGKEASVYLCEAHPATGEHLLAAKVYRPRMFRNLRNDALYREGRETLTEAGRAVKPTDQRIIRAINKKTGFGQQVAHTSWLMHEYGTLQLLHEAGAAVPKPFATSSNAILMSYIGDERMAAPALEAVSLEQEEAELLFQEVMKTVEIMLAHGRVHGDLSAYNILYWEGRITLIDFPQVIDINSNGHARRVLERDIERVCQYFTSQGVRADAGYWTRTLWRRHATTLDKQREADFSRAREEAREREERQKEERENERER